MSNNRFFGGLIITIGVFAAVLILIFIKKGERDLLSFVSVIGTNASLVALGLGYLQIISLKESSNQIKKEVEKTVHRVDIIVSISDISKTKTLIEDIQTNLRSGRYDGAIIRMGDLKDALISAKFINGLERIKEDHLEYNKIVMNTGIDINSINDFLIKKKGEPDISLILRHLEKTKYLLVECYNKIKKLGYDIN